MWGLLQVLGETGRCLWLGGGGSTYNQYYVFTWITTAKTGVHALQVVNYNGSSKSSVSYCSISLLGKVAVYADLEVSIALDFLPGSLWSPMSAPSPMLLSR